MTYARFHKDVVIPVLGPVRLHWDFERGDVIVYHITSQDETVTWFLPDAWVWWTVTGAEQVLEWYITGDDIRDAYDWLSSE